MKRFRANDTTRPFVRYFWNVLPFPCRSYLPPPAPVASQSNNKNHDVCLPRYSYRLEEILSHKSNLFSIYNDIQHPASDGAFPMDGSCHGGRSIQVSHLSTDIVLSPQPPAPGRNSQQQSYLVSVQSSTRIGSLSYPRRGITTRAGTRQRLDIDAKEITR